MGFRFRRTVSVLPGVHLNMSKSGGSVSIGKKGAMLNLGRGGETVSLGIPGTGLGYRTSRGGFMLLLLLLAGLLAAIWLFDPDLLRPLLHRWQPHWF